jgi:hypothetical protein
MLRATTRATRLVLALSSTVGQPLSATPPTFHMAAVTFNPLVLSAKASVRGAAVRRAGAKASKRAAFAVKASDDDMDFMVRAAAFFRFRDGARIDASRRRATGRRGERGRDRHARRATPRRAAFGSTPNASRPRQTDARSRTADGRSDGSRTRIRRTRFLSRFLRVFSIARGGRVVVSPCLSLATMSVSIRAVSVSDLLDLSTHFPFSFA